MRSGRLSTLFFTAAFAATTAGATATAIASPRAEHRAAVGERAPAGVTRATPGVASPDDDAARYAARERSTPRAVQDFQGGSTFVLIGSSTAVVVLLVVLLIVLV